jgi:putative oxidoreductase
MSLPSHTARAMLAALFIGGGLKQLRHPEHLADIAEPITTPVSDAVPALPQKTTEMVKLDGAVKLGGGLLLAVGPFHRPAALALAGSLVPTTLAAHRFWEETDPRVRQEQQIHFMKNLGLLGGLLLAALDTGGRPSVPWTTRKAAHHAATAAGKTAGSTRDSMAEAVATLAASAGALSTVARNAGSGRGQRRRQRSGHWPATALPAGLRRHRRHGSRPAEFAREAVDWSREHGSRPAELAREAVDWSREHGSRPAELAREAVDWSRERARHAPDAVAHAAGKMQDAATTAKDRVSATLSS